ncbi:hypothetical protein SEA_SCHWARTZ33_2 [Gordonia phage Schwartz33]|nr:hypothetical protein SEA_SCHWARTZ33_2 [Gordonia phage Schwartz33]
MGLYIKATKRTEEQASFAFILSSLPSTEDEVVDGNDTQGILDGNPG